MTKTSNLLMLEGIDTMLRNFAKNRKEVNHANFPEFDNDEEVNGFALEFGLCLDTVLFIGMANSSPIDKDSDNVFFYQHGSAHDFLKLLMFACAANKENVRLMKQVVFFMESGNMDDAMKQLRNDIINDVDDFENNDLN